MSLTAASRASPPPCSRSATAWAIDPVRLWMELEELAAAELPLLVHEIVASASGVWPAGSPELRRLHGAARAAERGPVRLRRLDRGAARRCRRPMALGATSSIELVGLRAFDGLDTDDILAIGWEQLEAMHEARREAGRADRPRAQRGSRSSTASRPTDRPTSRPRCAAIARPCCGHATSSTSTTWPRCRSTTYSRSCPRPSTCAARCRWRPTSSRPPSTGPSRGVYVVTPSVDDDAGAMLEHNWASIVNTSVHEAYPGHHLQLSAALSTPTPARLLVEAPEFVEGWGMYCEQMMLEQGFEDTPERRVIVATDAIWRAARIILDIRLHRGEISVDEAIDFLVEHTGFERPVARAEVYRYTQTPGYNLSYLLGKVLLLRLRADEQERLGQRLQPQALPRCAALLGQPAHLVPSTPAGRRGRRSHRSRGRAARADVGHPQPRPAERPLAPGVVARCLDRQRAHRPIDPRRSPRRCVAQGAPAIHLVDLDGAGAGRAGQPRGHRRRSPGPWPSPCSWPAAWTGRSRSRSPSRPAPRAWSCRCGRWSRTARCLAECLRIGGDWLAVGMDARPESLRGYPWRHRPEPTLDELVIELHAAGVRRFVFSHVAGNGIGAGGPALVRAVSTRRSRVAGGVSTLDGCCSCAMPASPGSSWERRYSPAPSTWARPSGPSPDRDHPAMSRAAASGNVMEPSSMQRE